MISKGEGLGILYYELRSVNTGDQYWTVGVHNGVALENIAQGKTRAQVAHYASVAEVTKNAPSVLNMYAPCGTDSGKCGQLKQLDRYYRIASEEYPSQYAGKMIGFSFDTDRVNNGGFDYFQRADGTREYNLNRVIQFTAAQLSGGTLVYHHWNLVAPDRIPGLTGSFSGRSFLVFEEGSKTKVGKVVKFPEQLKGLAEDDDGEKRGDS